MQREIPFETLLNIILARHKAKQKIMFLFSLRIFENKIKKPITTFIETSFQQKVLRLFKYYEFPSTTLNNFIES